MNSDVSIDPVNRLKNLNQKASDFACDNKIPIKRYIRSTREMERMALIYEEENQYENGFLLYMKLITFLLEKLPKHPQYKDVLSDERKNLKKRCNCALQSAEKLKVLLKEEFQKEYDEWLLKEEKRRKKRELEEQKKKEELEKQKEISRNTSLLGTTTPPLSYVPVTNGGSNNTTPHIATLNDTSSFPRVPTVSSTDTSQPSAPPLDNDLSSSSSSHPVNSSNPVNSSHFNSSQPPPYSSQESQHTTYHPPPSSHSPQKPPNTYEQLPSYHDSTNQNSHFNNINQLPKFDRASKPSLATKPEINRNTKPDERTFRQDSTTTSLDGNRRVVISPDLVPRFLQIAEDNTAKNLETCGILTGKLARNAFCITHLVIPKQSATSDSCTTEAEEEMFDVQDKYDLVTLGWIHTHPSQTSFLSSVDLHTQCSYQQLMPEAIAIVCSPKYKTTGVYRLTPSYGVKFISSCTKPGFHPHPKEPPLYEESPLVSVDNSLKIEVVDLR